MKKKISITYSISRKKVVVVGMKEEDKEEKEEILTCPKSDKI